MSELERIMANKQISLHFPPQVIEKKRLVDDKDLLGCDSWRDALLVGLNKKYNQILNLKGLAEAMEIKAGHFNEIINKSRNRYFDFDRLEELEGYLGNTAISQFFDLQRRGLLHRQQYKEMSVEEKAQAYDRMTA